MRGEGLSLKPYNRQVWTQGLPKGHGVFEVFDIRRVFKKELTAGIGPESSKCAYISIERLQIEGFVEES